MNASPAPADPLDMLAADLARFYADPLGHVLWAYPWGRGELKDSTGPRDWQRDYLVELGELVRSRGFDGINPVEPIRMTTASGHGIGKSALSAWIIKWIMDTRPRAKGTVTANTADQLRTKTWAELGKWHKRSLTRDLFNWTGGKGSLALVSVEEPEAWRCDGFTCREENSEAFAGQHAADSTPFYLFDEASAVPDSIFEVAEGGLTDGEPMMFLFGNPTRTTGRFRETHGRLRHRWSPRQIDSRTVEGTNKALLDEWVADYGEDSDFVKVRVRGMFPSASLKQYIPTDLVDAAYGRELLPQQYSWAPVILTVDPAWEGDDEFVIGKRQGLKFEILHTVPKNDDDVLMANLIARYEDEYRAAAVFVDGGFGTGIVSVGKSLNRLWRLVWFSEGSNDPGCLNKRAEMWKLAKDWLKEGGSIPADPVLHQDLISPEALPRLDGKLQLEAKKDMKKRGMPSPNRGDALVLSFAHPVYERPDPYHDEDAPRGRDARTGY